MGTINYIHKARYAVFGEGEPIIWVHGLGSQRGSWHYQIANFKKDYRVVTIDLLGHGVNRTDKPITLTTMAADVIDILNELGIQSAHFVGHSLGGVVVQEILESYPGYVTSTVLANTMSILPTCVGSTVAQQRIKKLKEIGVEAYENDVFNNCSYKRYGDKKYREFLERLLLSINPNTYPQAAVSPVGVNYTNTLLTNTKPMLVIGSLFDRVTPYINALTTYGFARGAKLKTFYNSGHIPQLEEYEEFNQTLSDFWANLTR